MDIKKQILIGSFLGDGCIYYRERIEKGKKKDYLRKSLTFTEGHTLKQKKYLLWKNKYLNFCMCETKKVIMMYRGDNKNELFINLRRGYLDGKKVKIDKKLLFQLEKLGILVWYLDDGTFTYPKIEICTDSFNLKTQKLFIQFFKEKLGISPKLKELKNFNRWKGTYSPAYRLVFNSKELRKLLEILKETFLEYGLPKNMFYKLDLERQLKEFRNRSHSYYLKNKDKIKNRAREWEKTKKGRKSKAKYREDNREKLRNQNKILQEKNREKYNKNRVEKRNLKRLENPKFCVDCNAILKIYQRKYCNKCKCKLVHKGDWDRRNRRRKNERK